MTPLLVICLLLPASGPGDFPAPDTLRLGEAHSAAWAHFPSREQMPLHDEIARLRRADLRARFKPSVSAAAQAVYHSDVLAFPFELPGNDLPSIARDQYRASVDVAQLIYDGGVASSQARVEDAAADLAQEQVEADFQQVRERINAAYFSALVQDAAIATLLSLREDLLERRRELEARIRQGVAPAGTADVLHVEVLRIDQMITEARQQRRASIAVLGILTGLDLSQDVALVEPSLPEVASAEPDGAPARPEHDVFESQREQLELQKALASSKLRPSVAGTATFAYGRPPGLNLFENDPAPFYSIGVQFRWPLFRNAGRDRQIIDLQKQILDTREESFGRAVAAAAERELHEIRRLEATIEADAEIVRLRKQIADRARGRLDLGEVTPTEYLLEEHAHHQAQLALKRHHIELQFARVRYLTTWGLSDEYSEDFR